MSEVSQQDRPYIYTLKAILDNNEIYDSADCDMIREHRGAFSGKLPEYVAKEEYLKLKQKIEQFHWWLYNKDAPQPCGAKAESEIRAKFREFFGPKQEPKVEVT
jgi:hypothetical protein